MHWDGTSWSIVPSPTPGGLADLAAVVAVGLNDVWAAGGSVDRQVNAGRTLVERWDGMGWTVVASPNKGPSDNHLWGISAATGRTLAVGDRFSGGGRALWSRFPWSAAAPELALARHRDPHPVPGDEPNDLERRDGRRLTVDRRRRAFHRPRERRRLCRLRLLSAVNTGMANATSLCRGSLHRSMEMQRLREVEHVEVQGV